MQPIKMSDIDSRIKYVNSNHPLPDDFGLVRGGDGGWQTLICGKLESYSGWQLERGTKRDIYNAAYNSREIIYQAWSDALRRSDGLKRINGRGVSIRLTRLYAFVTIGDKTSRLDRQNHWAIVGHIVGGLK